MLLKMSLCSVSNPCGARPVWGELRAQTELIYEFVPSARKVVELSTAHLRKEDKELLRVVAQEHQSAIAEIDRFAPVVLESRYGFVIAIGELTVKALKEKGASVELRSLLEWCLDPVQGIVYLAFDRDAAELDELPVFDW